MTPEEYLRLERADEWKNEYIDGEMVAMRHEPMSHLVIVMNLASELHDQLREGPCSVLMLRMRISTDPRRHYTYPDVVVVCDRPQCLDDEEDTLTNPKVIAEVYSDATEAADRGVKFERYRSIPTFSEYLLVAMDRVHVECWTRQSDRWIVSESNDLQAEVDLVSLGCRLRIAEIYRKIAFASEPQ